MKLLGGIGLVIAGTILLAFPRRGPRICLALLALLACWIFLP